MAMVQLQIAEATFIYHASPATDFYRRDYVSAADGYRFISLREGNFATGSLIPGYHLRGTGVWR